MNNNPMVTKNGILDMQICVPENWTDEQAEKFANQSNPSGIQSKWSMKHNGDESLCGCDERVCCEERDGFVHIVLQC